MTRAEVLTPAELAPARQTEDTLELSPLFRVERRAGRLVATAGQGVSRQAFEIDGTGSDALLALLLALPVSERATLEESLAQGLGVEASQAHDLCDLLIAARVLVGSAAAAALRGSGQRWERWGWRDAFDFHTACRDSRFHAYDSEQFRQRIDAFIADEQNIGPQPPPYKEYPDRRSIPLDRLEAGSAARQVTLAEALLGNWPVAYFDRRGLGIEDIAELLAVAFGVQREVDDAFLGWHALKAYPSGGARHPLEVYLAARDVRGLEPGIYHYHPREHAVVQVNTADALDPINDACFEKPGIETASAILFMTVRWFRHNWKYRYPRSYRMVLIEIGHAIQTACLAGALTSAQVYTSYAINDDMVSEMLGLSDDCEELPVMAIGLGERGVV